MGTSFSGVVSSNKLTPCPGDSESHLSNVKEIKDWIRRYEPYGSKKADYNCLKSAYNLTFASKLKCLSPNKNSLSINVLGMWYKNVNHCKLLHLKWGFLAKALCKPTINTTRQSLIWNFHVKWKRGQPHNTCR